MSFRMIILVVALFSQSALADIILTLDKTVRYDGGLWQDNVTVDSGATGFIDWRIYSQITWDEADESLWDGVLRWSVDDSLYGNLIFKDFLMTEFADNTIFHTFFITDQATDVFNDYPSGVTNTAVATLSELNSPPDFIVSDSAGVTFETQFVSIPSTLLLLVLGVAGIGFFHRKPLQK